jgi:hypothetical protein
MFKRLFGAPSQSTSSSQSRLKNAQVGTGSSASGRAAFDAVDKLKDVRLKFFSFFKTVLIRYVFML